ncbi:MAG TPA: peptidoglycan bridge formation glycyltransferase FemA/FemB family protein [Candidatus Saccharibacteria bacterium]|nr:peptidoglycan bridge formation glycyltransferase FemA/FemB family protein [Candidatus Saccharibacteria bacterium]
MMRIERCDNSEQWDEFILNHEGHPLQLWGWGQLKASHGWIAERLFYVKEDVVVAAAQVLVRRLPAPFRRFAYIPRGPIVSPDDEAAFYDALAEYVKREHKAVALSVEPEVLHGELSSGWVQAKNTILAPATIQLDLQKTEKNYLTIWLRKPVNIFVNHQLTECRSVRCAIAMILMTV